MHTILMRKRLDINNLRLTFLGLMLGLGTLLSAQSSAPLPLIPWPQEVTQHPGVFILEKGQRAWISTPALINELELWNEALGINFGFHFDTTHTQAGAALQLIEAPMAKEGAYQLEVTTSGIVIRGSRSGIFYGFQTLLQLLPTNSEQASAVCVTIKDEPRFAWRGMHLDVCRHFFPVDFVKQYIDLIASYKMNTFHWHLTDDQGWRIEIKQYPELSRVAAWRKGSMIGPYSDHKFDSIRYGGIYTQEEIKEVVAYAAKRHVTIVPEIEMPGHAQAAIAAYPNLSCTGKPIDVAMEWGVLEDVFCPKEETFTFLENVLTEVMALFPGRYIHIGGDECPKTRWKACPHCQALMKQEGLKTEHELQSYFIRHMERFVNSKGRQIIGWDEILEGGLPPNASVMSWRGTEGGLEAARQGHDVVMSPGAYCYFDHYQGAAAYEPLAIGGYTPVEKVYAFEPIPAGLSKKEAKHILGAQANLWTEYIHAPREVEYMVLPRMCALAEVVWTAKEKKDETSFLLRLQQHFALLTKRRLTYSTSLYHADLNVSPSKKAGEVEVSLKANPVLGKLRYTTNGDKPRLASQAYDKPLLINKNTTIKAALFHEGELKGPILVRNIEINKATNRPITLKTLPSPYYNTGGVFTLVDGVTAQVPRVNTEWLAWSGADMEVVIDLQSPQKIEWVRAGFLKEEGSWIYMPTEVQLSVSADGKAFTPISTLHPNDPEMAQRWAYWNLSVAAMEIRYVKIVAKNAGKIPSGNSGAGEDAWLFCDEIIIK